MIHDVLSSVLQHVADLVGEVDLVPGGGDVLVVVEVSHHVPRCGLGLS